MDAFSSPRDPNTLAWILVSAVAGGLITYSFRFLFERHLPSWQLKRKTQVSVQKYQLPLLLYGYAAENSLLKTLKNKEALLDEDSRLRTLFYVCAFLGWCQVLSRKSLIEFVNQGIISSRAIGSFGSHYNSIVRGLSSMDYFLGLENSFDDPVDIARVPALAATAIGDSMIREDQKVDSLYPEVIGFKEFVHCYRCDHEAKHWFSYIEKILDYKSRSRSDIKWNRLVILYIHIHVFTYYLEARNKTTFSRIKGYIDRFRRLPRSYVRVNRICEDIHPVVRELLKTELTRLNYPFTYGEPRHPT